MKWLSCDECHPDPGVIILIALQDGELKKTKEIVMGSWFLGRFLSEGNLMLSNAKLWCFFPDPIRDYSK